jgi:cholinesterase
VTLTYRLGVLGFPGAPGGIQNLGLRDQRRAVEWVHQNIAAFGGDASKVTIFGQSSGGVAADWWTYAYKDKPLINGIIMESGNAFSFPMNPQELQARNWQNVSDTLGCNSSGDAIECVRSKPWQDILAAAARLPAAPGGNPVRSTPAFYPTIDNQTVFSDYASLLEKGRFAKIVSCHCLSGISRDQSIGSAKLNALQPQLLGNNNYEQGYYVIPAFGRGINTTAAQRDQFLLESFTCPNDFKARMGKAHGVPTWVYRYFGDWTNTRLYPSSGAYHGTELQMLFGNSEDVSGIPASAPQVQLTKVMQNAWLAFAKDPVNGLSEFGWPQFELGKKTLVRLGFENSPEPDFVRPKAYSGNCSGVVLAGGR